MRWPSSPATRFAAKALRHLAELLFGRQCRRGGAGTAARGERRRRRHRALPSLRGWHRACSSGLLRAGSATVADLVLLHRLIVPALANAVVLVSGYLAVASLVWGIADATMDQPLDLAGFDDAPPAAGPGASRIFPTFMWSASVMASASRADARGPRGNERLAQAAGSRLAAIHADRPARPRADHRRHDRCRPRRRNGPNSSTCWRGIRTSRQRMLMLPGNHDVNIVDRANPARLDLPTSPGKRLRQMRTLSAIAAVQGERVHVVDRRRASRARRSIEALAPHRRRDRGLCRRRRPAPVAAGLVGMLDDAVPDGAAARRRRTASASCSSTPTPRRISPSPMRSA